MTAGFILLALMGTVFSIVPSAFLLRAGWRRGGVARAGAVVWMLLLAALALPMLVAPDVGGFEERVGAFLAAWFVLLLVMVGLWAMVQALSGLVRAVLRDG